MRDRRHHRAQWALATGFAALVSVASAAAGWNGEGRVVAVNPAEGTVVLDHGDVPGLLPASRARFVVARPDMLRGVLPGDRVHFTLLAADDAHGLLRVTSLAPEAPGGTGPWATAFLVAALVVVLGALAAVIALIIRLGRSVGALHRRLAALDHEAGMLRRLEGETQDAVRQVAHALERIAATVLVGYVQGLRARLPATGAAPGDAAASRHGGSGPALMVVQRGRTDVFRALESGVGDADLQLIWDRRRSERRASHRGVATERRRAERRALPPETWARFGFVLAPVISRDAARGGEARGPRPLRAVGVDRGPASR